MPTQSHVSQANNRGKNLINLIDISPRTNYHLVMRPYQVASCIATICICLVSSVTGQVPDPKTPNRLSALIQSLDDPDPQKRTQAVQRLLNLGEPARAALRLVLPTASPQARPLMDRVMLHIHWVKPEDNDSIEQVFTGYAALSAEARFERLQPLADPKIAGADGLLRVLLNDPSGPVRWVAADYLQRLFDAGAPVTQDLKEIVNGAPWVMYLPLNQNAPLLAAAGWIFHDKEPRRTDDMLQRAVALETEHPSATLGQMDFVYQWLVERADAHRDRSRMVQLLRQQASRTSWTDDRIPQPVADLIATQAEYGPLAGFNNDLRTYRNYFGHPQMVYAMGKLAQRQGYPHLAQGLDAAAFLMSGTSAEEHLIAGDFLQQHEWNAAAEREFRWSLKLSDGKSPFIYYRLAALAVDRNDELAAGQYEELAVQRTTDFTRVDRYGRTVPWTSDDEWAVVHWHYLRAAREAHDAAAVKMHLDKLMSLDAQAHVFQHDPSISADVVPALQDQGRLDEADNIFRQGYEGLHKLMDDAPEDAMAKNNLAWLCACAGMRLDDGKKFADQAVADMPADAACLDTQAEIYWRMGDAKNAAAIEAHALAIKPEDTYMAKQLLKFNAAVKSAH